MRDIGGPQPLAPVSESVKRMVSGPIISCILHQRFSTVMLIIFRRSSHHSENARPVFDIKYTMVTPHTFSEAERRDDDSDDSLYGMTVRAN